MDYYIDITVLSDPEFDTTTLMNALYSKLHRVLAATDEEKVGVSFPNLKNTPGDLLRLHAEQSVLEQLMDRNWLKGLGDYTCVTEIKVVPDKTQHIRVKRIQSKMTAARLRRAVKRGSISVHEAEILLSQRKLLKKPFFQLQSSSTSRRFPLFIKQGNSQAEAVRGGFTSYGLSDKTTVPWF